MKSIAVAVAAGAIAGAALAAAARVALLQLFGPQPSIAPYLAGFFFPIAGPALATFAVVAEAMAPEEDVGYGWLASFAIGMSYASPLLISVAPFTLVALPIWNPVVVRRLFRTAGLRCH